MTRGVCVCGKEGYTRCTVHGDPLKGVGVTDAEFVELIVRNKGAVLEVFAAGEVVPMKKISRLNRKAVGR